jgi:hypothetical protein
VRGQDEHEANGEQRPLEPGDRDDRVARLLHRRLGRRAEDSKADGDQRDARPLATS